MQASLLPADCSTGQRGGKKDSSKAMAALDIITPAVALPIEFAHPRGLTPPSSSTQLGVPAAPQTNMHSMLAESCGAQPPSTSASNGRKMQAHCMRTLHGARAHRLVHTPCFRKHRQRAPLHRRASVHAASAPHPHVAADACRPVLCCRRRLPPRTRTPALTRAHLPLSFAPTSFEPVGSLLGAGKRSVLDAECLDQWRRGAWSGRTVCQGGEHA